MRVNRGLVVLISSRVVVETCYKAVDEAGDLYHVVGGEIIKELIVMDDFVESPSAEPSEISFSTHTHNTDSFEVAQVSELHF